MKKFLIIKLILVSSLAQAFQGGEWITYHGKITENGIESDYYKESVVLSGDNYSVHLQTTELFGTKIIVSEYKGSAKKIPDLELSGRLFKCEYYGVLEDLIIDGKKILACRVERKTAKEKITFWFAMIAWGLAKKQVETLDGKYKLYFEYDSSGHGEPIRTKR